MQSHRVEDSTTRTCLEEVVRGVQALSEAAGKNSMCEAMLTGVVEYMKQTQTTLDLGKYPGKAKARWGWTVCDGLSCGSERSNSNGYKYSVAHKNIATHKNTKYKNVTILKRHIFAPLKFSFTSERREYVHMRNDHLQIFYDVLDLCHDLGRIFWFGGLIGHHGFCVRRRGVVVHDRKHPPLRTS